MISTLTQDNSQETQNWLHSSVQSFFSDCNWDNQTQRSHTKEVERLEQAAAIETFTELSFELRVRQFFAAVNWDGTSIAPPSVIEPLPEPSDGFTLTDFSDLF